MVTLYIKVFLFKPREIYKTGAEGYQFNKVAKLFIRFQDPSQIPSIVSSATMMDKFL